MKRISLIAGILFFIGCGGGSSGSNNKTEIISGKVVDGYVKNAKVCVDLNKNFKCDNNEPFTFSNEKGEYTLEIPSNQEEILISIGGIDTSTNKEAITMLSSTKYKNITPFTTLAIKEGEEKVETLFNITKDKIANDPMQDNELKNLLPLAIEKLKKNIFIEKAPTIPTIINQNKEINSSKENNITANQIDYKKGDSNIPPQINIENLTPPKIGE